MRWPSAAWTPWVNTSPSLSRIEKRRICRTHRGRDVPPHQSAGDDRGQDRSHSDWQCTHPQRRRCGNDGTRRNSAGVRRGSGGFNLRAQVTGSLPAASRVLVETPAQQIGDSRIEVRRQETVVRFPHENSGHRLGRRVRVKCAPARQHLVEDGAEGEHVAAVIGDRPLRLFGRHVPGGAHDHSGLRREHAQGRRVRDGR